MAWSRDCLAESHFVTHFHFSFHFDIFQHGCTRCTYSVRKPAQKSLHTEIPDLQCVLLKKLKIILSKYINELQKQFNNQYIRKQ